MRTAISLTTSLTLASLVLLSGCAGGFSVADLQASAKTARTSTAINATPAEVYQRLVTQSRACLAKPPWRVEADYFTANNTGRVTAMAATSSLILTLWSADVAPGDTPGTTTLTLQHRATEAPFGVTVPQWAAGQPAPCPIK